MNNQTVFSIISKMAEGKPSLQKYITAEPDEDIDHRVLGDLIIKNFPWPIGIELRRLLSGSLQRPDRGRLDQIFKTIERTMQFISYLLISQLWEEKREQKLELTKEFTDQFAKRITTTTLGNFSWMIRSASTILNSTGRNHFVAEMDGAFNRKFFELLDFWAPERNDIGHYQINLTQDEIEKRCVEYEERLGQLLQSIAFLSNYKLVTMRQIVVKKFKHKDAEFNHYVDLLNSSDSDFKGAEVLHNKYADSSSVLLLKDFKVPNECLNLSPLIIDSRLEVIDNKLKFAIKKDIFLFSKFQNDKLYYTGTEVTEKVDLTSLSIYTELLGEFREMLANLSAQAVAI